MSITSFKDKKQRAFSNMRTLFDFYGNYKKLKNNYNAKAQRCAKNVKVFFSFLFNFKIFEPTGKVNVVKLREPEGFRYL
jgi:hypothetical protein